MSVGKKGEAYDVVVVGAGLAGLTAAAYLARAGKKVVVLERSSTIGGRAASQRSAGYTLNFGPHALYAAADGVGVLRELGVSFRGVKPAVSGGYALRGGRKHALPSGFVSLLTTGLFGVADKIELARLLSSLSAVDASGWDGRTVREWLEATTRRGAVRELLSALVRLTSYCHAEDVMCAGVAIRQLRQGLSDGVYYLDDGWQTLVDGLRESAACSGAVVRTGVRAEVIEHDGRVRGVRTAEGELLSATCAVLTVPPASASALAGPAVSGLAKLAAGAVRVRAACLDLRLSRLPIAHAKFALGVDRPHYFSVHSATAKLAPAGGAVIHAAKYLSPAADSVDADVRAELEAVVDLLQPGWREVLVEARFLPQMTVVEAMTTAASGGLAGRPAVAVSELPGLYLAGDWVGERGLLADASFASAKLAAARCLDQLECAGSTRDAA